MSQSDVVTMEDEQHTKYVNHKAQQHQEHVQYDVETWYPLLRGHTAPSIFLPISAEQGAAILHFYRFRFYNEANQFTKQDYLLLKQLEESIHQNFLPNKQYFVRCSSRSPKDGINLSYKTILDEYHQTWEQLKRDYPPQNAQEHANLQLVASSTLTTSIIRVNNAKEAMNLLLTSERVFVDFLAAQTISHVIPWNTNLIIREWDDRIDGMMEFRLFVKNEKLIGMSQYNHMCMFPQLIEQFVNNPQELQKLRATLVSSWETIHKIITNSETVPSEVLQAYREGYIVDFAVFEDDNGKYNTTVIELNPYARSTGAALFSWNEIDHIVENEAPAPDFEPELRFKTEIMLNVKDFVEIVILPGLKETSLPYYEYFHAFESTPSPPQDSQGGLFKTITSLLSWRKQS